METLFGALPIAARFFIAFLIVLALIVLTFWAIRRFGGIGLGTGAARGRQPRLAVIDAAAVDGRRRLVLIRRDNVEHLLMIGGPSDIVVEQNIVRAAPATSSHARPAPPASDAELTDMAQRLEAALRRPVAPGQARVEPGFTKPTPAAETAPRPSPVPFGVPPAVREAAKPPAAKPEPHRAVASEAEHPGGPEAKPKSVLDS